MPPMPSMLRMFPGTMMARNNGQRFQIKSNMHPDRCLTLQNFFGTYVANPQTKRNDFIPVAFLAPCKRNNPAQMFQHMADGKLEANGRCVSTLATTDKRAYPNGDPCEEHAILEKAGTILFGLRCDPNPNDYQTWIVGNGLIKSGCPHGYYIAHDERFFALSGRDNYGDMVLAKFAKNETTIAHNIAQAPFDILNVFVGDDLRHRILNHGCWCGKFNQQPRQYFGGSNTADDLDKLCKKWSMTRRCNREQGGACFHQVIDEEDTYTFSQDSLDRPWNGDYSCGEAPGHLNGDNPCKVANCRIDVKFAEEIADFFFDYPDWEEIEATEDLCHGDYGVDQVISGMTRRLATRSGSQPDSKTEDVTEMESTLSINAPASICVGEAPFLEFKRV